MDESELPPPPSAVRKRELRADARTRRSLADPADRIRDGARWAERVGDLVAAHDARTVAVYVSYGTEPPTDALIAALSARGVRLLVPVLLEDRDLDWATHDDPDVLLGRDAIATADLVVLPALLAGADGARLGQGGGSYDRALTRVRPAVPLVALVHDDEVAAAGSIPVESHDRPVTHVLTPDRSLAVALPVDDLPVDPELDDVAASTRSGELDVALVVAAGGMVGAAARWALNEALPHSGGAFPWATFLENVSGAFALGALAVVLLRWWGSHRYARPFLAVGVLGGFTTFSTYVADVRGLTDDGHASTALLYLLLTIGCGLVAAALGMRLGRALPERSGR